MNFVPAPYPDDVEDDFGPYNRDEVVVARASLLHSLNRENSMVWQGIKYKLGILPNGQRLRTFDSDHVWLPPDIPYLWSAPVILHDPTAPAGCRMEDQGTETEKEEVDQVTGDGKKNEKEESSSRSEAEATGAELSPSSDDDGTTNATSDRLSRKRSFEGHCSRDGEVLVASDDIDSEMGSQKKRKTSVTKKKTKKISTVDSSLKVSITEDISIDMGEGSSQHGKLDDAVDGDVHKQFEVVFQCDLCNFFSLKDDKIQQHLKVKGHYSASRYLALREGRDRELRLVYLSAVSLIKQSQHMFKEKVAACPLCHSIFPSLPRCLDHTFHNHNEDGLYSFREITKLVTFDLVKDTSICAECGVTFQDKDLQSHVKKTQHMASYIGEKTSQPMMIFPCPFCQIVHFNYISYKSHVFDKHGKEMPPAKAQTAVCCLLGESQLGQTMLPKDPGISLANINYDFSRPVLPGDPGFPGGHWSKGKKQRKKIKRLAQLGLLPSTTEKNKKQRASHAQRLAVFKAKRTEMKTGKKRKEL